MGDLIATSELNQQFPIKKPLNTITEGKNASDAEALIPANFKMNTSCNIGCRVSTGPPETA